MKWEIINTNTPILSCEYRHLVKDGDVVCIQAHLPNLNKDHFFHNLNYPVDGIFKAVAYWRIKKLKP